MKPRILVVEDDRIERTALLAILQKEPDWEIHEAKNGQAALDLLCDRLNPNVCLVDLKMPQMGGVELLQRMRRDPELKQLKVVVASATRDRDTIVTCSRLDIAGYLLKPYDAEKTLAVLRPLMVVNQQAASPILATRNLLARTALVVDDDEVDRETLTTAVKSSPGWDVAVATNGREALERMRQGLRPDVCLIDLRMPELDGTGFLKQLREDPHLRQLPVFVVSGEKAPGAIRELAQYQVAGYLLKPCDPVKLKAALDRVAGVEPARPEA